uniref:DUF4704 domain-containing protein n=1 Tax=Electrophorus electricus TaxID=8005 RepID=A0AAY5EMX6_ELEEL
MAKVNAMIFAHLDYTCITNFIHEDKCIYLYVLFKASFLVLCVAKNCMKICIQNLQKMNKQVPGPVLAEVAVSVFSFVKDSYPISSALFEEFENNDGYTVLQSIMAWYVFTHSENLLDLIASLTLFGKAELKVALCVNNPQPPDFKFDPPLTKGFAVKNLKAFQIIQSSFLRSSSTLTCTQILRTVQKIWSWDKANFFLLEWTLQSLAQLAECVWQKPVGVHGLFFELLETVVIQLSYIPHDVLRKVHGVLKEGVCQAFSVAALRCLRRLVEHSTLLTDVLSDSGLMELLLLELRKRAKILRKAGKTKLRDCDRQLTTNMLNVVAALSLRSIKNTVCIKDLGMIPYIKIFLDDEQFRGPALCVLEQLAQMNPEEFMSTAVGALCSSTETEIQLKHDLLQSILRVLDNPNSLNAFRTACGFNALLSMVVDMEGALLEQPTGVWASISHHALMDLLLLALHTVALAVHLNLINTHFFHATGQYERLAEALLRLGCFSSRPMVEEDVGIGHRSFLQFVEVAESSALPAQLQDCVRLLRFLEQFATGVCMDVDSYTGLQEAVEIEQKQETLSRTVGIFSMLRFSSDLTILHPGGIKVIMTLLPHIYCPSDPQLSAELQLAVAHHVQAMVKSEQNRQIMCESGLLVTLLNHCGAILSSSTLSLHLPVVRVFEKLASQSIDHKSLRRFLCFGDPFKCSTENWVPTSFSEAKDFVDGDTKVSKRPLKRGFSLLQTSSGGGVPVPLHRIISLVSLTSPRSLWPHKVSVSPSFVEFDMTDSGYGCLFLPSLATVKGVSADSIPTGGIGSDCRGFPPSAGLSFSCWFLISRFSSACDAHPVRLLNLVRHMSRAEQQFSCLSVSISASDGCLVISTEEEAYQFLDMMEPEVRAATTLPVTVRFKCSRQLIPGQWHYLVVAMAKDIKKSCKVTAYLDGEVIGTSKMRYIQPFPGQCIAMDPSAVIDVCGIIGTPPIWKQRAALIWRIGPTYLFEEVLSSDSVEIMYTQGTKYLGNYLAVDAQGGLVSPERISFGINPAVSTVTTIAEIRDEYNEVDCRLIAKEMGITSRDNSTPVFLAQNISQHLIGTARTIGAALVAHFGVRTFMSISAATSFQYIGGAAVVLSLVAMASDDSSLYASVKVLLSVLDTNPVMRQEMKRIGGYKLFAFLLKMKAQLVTRRTFQLVLAIVGTIELGTSYVHDLTALQDLLCDFEVWQKTPESLDISVLNHFVDILNSSSGDPRNAEAIHSLNLMTRLLFQLHDPAVTHGKVTLICTILSCLLQGHFSTEDIRRHNLFMNEKNKSWSTLSQTPARTVWIRNQLLEVLSSLIISDTPLLNNSIQEEVFFTLGSDWFLLFLQRQTHSSTVLLVLQLLIHFLSNPAIMAKFKEGVSLGTLVENMEMPLEIIGNLKTRFWSHECLSCTCPGFTVLPKLLLSHISLPQVYGAIAALLLGKADLPMADMTNGQLHLNLGKQLGFHFLKKPVTGSEDSWEVQYPGSVMQFLCLVHSLFPRDPLWTSPDFLSSLASAVFPSEDPEVRHQLFSKCCTCFLTVLVCFQFSPEEVCQEQKQSFQSELLEFLMDIIHITGQEEGQSTHVARDGKSRSEGKVAILIENVVFFSKMLVEKLYTGMFVVDPENLLVFIAEQIAVREATVSVLYKNLNRALLYFLSRPRQSPAEKQFILRTLHVLEEHWDVIMATYNASVPFTSCLLHCLLLIRSGRYPHRLQHPLHCTSQKKVTIAALSFCLDPPAFPRALARRQGLEEAYKIDLSAKQAGKEGAVTMTDVSPLWEETAVKAWQVFIGQSPCLLCLLSIYIYRDLCNLCFSIPCFAYGFWMAAQWLRIEEDLLRERGLFGPGPGVFLNQGWVQDAAEGPNRTRPRIRRKALRRSKKVRTCSAVCVCASEISILREPSRDTEAAGSDCERLTFFPALTEALTPVEDLPEQCAEPQVILQQLAPNEKVRQCVAVVSGHILSEGVLLFGKAHLYVCEGFTLSSSGDVCCGSYHPSSVRDSFICGMLKKERSAMSVGCRRWPYEDIKEARFMRFLLEVRLTTPALHQLPLSCTALLNFKFSELHCHGGLHMCCTHCFHKGEISNFEYLMHLNTLAGRTYNDLMQYPVFPWVLADYQSETLDLSSAATFRDLSKPMGAQTQKRREKFIERYHEVDSNDGDLSAQCHYCTHYSSAIIVASYLVRMEPFSQTFIALQGGSFDVPERMFHSLQKEWESASKDNMSDVRELIPEFYYLPDFLINSNNFEFGCMQDGTSLGDVVLPPWAKGDPQEFIRMHREALESDYVSASLHLWIDLIFGYKQQGPPAAEALNTFHPYFYPDKHDAESMKNPLKKSTVLGYISNFGQIPKQVLTTPNTSRTMAKETYITHTHTHTHTHTQPRVTQWHNFLILMHGSVGHIVCGEKEVLVVEKNKLLMPPHWNTYFCWGYYDNTCSFGNYTAEKSFAVWEGLADWGEAVCASCPNSNTVITAGNSTVVCVWDVSITKDKLRHMKLKQALYGHTDTVTCVVASEAHSVIISGSQDQTCILWDLEELSYITQLPAHSSGVSALAINDLTGEIVSCAGMHLYLWTMKGQLLASVSTHCGAEGSVLCCCFTQKYEWDLRNVIVTGCADGIVRIWKTEYTKVQLPGHEERSESQGSAASPSTGDTGNTNTLHLNSGPEKESAFLPVFSCHWLC